MKNSLTIFASTILLLLAALPAAAQEMVKDINPGAADSFFPYSGMTVYDGKLYFSANNGVTGEELWTSDGTTTGTQLLKDINPESISSYPQNMNVFNGKLYFRANDGTHGREPWISDGTSAGTRLLKDLTSEGGDSNPRYFTPYDGKLYFYVIPRYDLDDALIPEHIGVTDGTETGTGIALYNVSTGDREYARIHGTYGDYFYYDIQRTSSKELYASDGTVAGTHLVKAFAYGRGRGVYGVFMAELGDKVYFGMDELWVTEGTVATSRLVKDIYPGAEVSQPRHITLYHDKLYFTANDPVHGAELWVSDGTNEGTLLLKDIKVSDVTYYDDLGPQNYFVHDDQLYFEADDGIHGTELWVTDGTTDNTRMVKDIFPGSSDGMDRTSFTSFNGKLYFEAYDGIHGVELWVTDGTESGTNMVMDINPGRESSRPSGLTVYNNELYFSADDDTHGFELWKYNGRPVPPPAPGHTHSDCPGGANTPPLLPAGATTGFLDYLCFHIDYKMLFHFEDCLDCRFNPCLICPSPCLTCPANFKEFGYAYEVTFSYDNPTGEKIVLPPGKQNFFKGIEQEKIGQTEVFEPGYHKNTFSVIAAPGQQVSWVLTDEKGNQRNIAYTLPEKLAMNVYPNPNHGLFKLSVAGSKDQPAHLSISNDQGDLISEEAFKLPYENTLDLSKHGKGLYFLKVSIGKESVTEKVMVQ